MGSRSMPCFAKSPAWWPSGMMLELTEIEPRATRTFSLVWPQPIFGKMRKRHRKSAFVRVMTPLVCLCSFFAFCIFPFALLDHLVRSRQNVGRNREADLLGGLQVDDELELRRLLHRQIGGLGSLQYLVHIRTARRNKSVKLTP